MDSFSELQIPVIVTNGESALIVAPAEGDLRIRLSLEFMSKSAGRNLIRIWTEQGHLTNDDKDRLEKLVDLMILAEDGDEELMHFTDLTARVFAYAEGTLAQYTDYINSTCAAYNKPPVSTGELLQAWMRVVATQDEGLYILENPDGKPGLASQLPDRPCILYDGSSALIYVPHTDDEGNFSWHASVEFDSISVGMALIERRNGSPGFGIDDTIRLMGALAQMPLSSTPGCGGLGPLTVHLIDSFGCGVDSLIRAFGQEDPGVETLHALWDACVGAELEVKIIENAKDASLLSMEVLAPVVDETTEVQNTPMAAPPVDTSDPLALAALWGGGTVDE